ncbi:MAG: phage holin family protein [Muribaculaceae bacterium]|nr:phage holin family protein [Muribaculaceae bacterium]
MEAHSIILFRTVAATFTGVLYAFFVPVAPAFILCTALVAIDVLTAWLLARRLARTSALYDGRLSSHALGRAVATLCRIYIFLLVAYGIESVVFEPGSVPVLRFAAGAVCFWQLISILENEATASDAVWASTLRRFLIDKASRHMKFPLDEDRH